MGFEIDIKLKWFHGVSNQKLVIKQRINSEV